MYSGSADSFAIGDDYTGTISPASESDFVAFAANGGETITIVASTILTGLPDSTLRLLDTDGMTELAFNDDFGSLASRVQFTLPPVAGSYFLEVESFANRSSGTYTLQLREAVITTSAGGRPYIIGGVGVVFEPCSISLDDPNAEPVTGTVSEPSAGIASVQLVAEFNLSATIDAFVPGDPSVGFSVARANTNFLGVGVIEGTTTLSEEAGDICEQVIQIGSLDPSGGITRPSGRGSRTRVPRPTPDTDGVRCVETGDPSNPDFMGIPFTPFTTDEVEIDVAPSTATTPFVCCEFIDSNGVISPPFCEEVSVVCDVDGNSRVDREDIRAIFGARGTQVPGPDPRDANGDGLITVNDGRECVLACTHRNCSSGPNPRLRGAERRAQRRAAARLRRSSAE